jgi:hypothetical protein
VSVSDKYSSLFLKTQIVLTPWDFSIKYSEIVMYSRWTIGKAFIILFYFTLLFYYLFIYSINLNVTKVKIIRIKKQKNELQIFVENRITYFGLVYLMAKTVLS